MFTTDGKVHERTARPAPGVMIPAKKVRVDAGPRPYEFEFVHESLRHPVFTGIYIKDTYVMLA